MQADPQKQKPAGGPVYAKQNHNGFHVHHASADVLLQRLDGVQKSGTGWRARCPACGGRSRKLSVAVSDDRVLVHCFSCNDAEAVLAAVNLRWSDLQPPRTWPQSPEQQRAARQAIRQSGWAAALGVLATEATILHLAALHLSDCRPLSIEDGERLALACHRIEQAALILIERDTWKPDYCYPPARLVAIKAAAVSELRRQLETAEGSLRNAERALQAFKQEAA